MGTVVLTQQEKVAGRLFRDQARARMEQVAGQEMLSAQFRPDTLRFVRHPCPLHAGRTWAVELKEHYILNPPMEGLEEGKLAFTWRMGRCRCGAAFRSDGGRVVAVADHPPLHGAKLVRLDMAG